MCSQARTTAAPGQCTQRKGAEPDPLRPGPLQTTAQHLRITRLKRGGDPVPPLVTKGGDLRLRGMAHLLPPTDEPLKQGH